MPIITITCPACDFSKEYHVSSIPHGSTTATCPRCQKAFRIDAAVPKTPEEASTIPAVADDFQPRDMTPRDMPAQVASGGATEGPPSTPPRPASVAPSRNAGAAPGEIVRSLTHEETPAPGSRQAPPKQPLAGKLHFSFHGSGRDYFGIWIVNTMLKIVTCGIYSAWAKVRQRRYFYGNTTLNGIPFEYLGDPLALFKGWLIAAVFFVLYSVATKIEPAITGVFSIIFFLGMPWLVVRSRTFNLRNSAHRNIRFTFTPNYREAYVVFAGLPLLLPFTLGLIAPYMVYRQKKFFVENSGYGRTRYTFEARPGDFYRVFVKAGLAFVAAAALLVAGILLVGPSIATLKTLALNKGSHHPSPGVIMFVPFLLLPLLYLFTSVYLRTALANLTWNGTRLKHSRFSSTLGVGAMAWLYLSSAVAIILSLGLLIPWAKVRLARYRFEHLTLELKDDDDSFLGWGHRDISSTGEEIGDLFGIDIGL